MGNPSASHHPGLENWWYQACRWLRRGLRFFWITIILGLGINVLSTRLTSQTNFPAESPVGWMLGHLLLSVLAGICLLLLTILIETANRRLPAPAPAGTSRSLTTHERLEIVRRLRQSYKAQLARSLPSPARMMLRFHECNDVIRSSAQLVFHRTYIAQEAPLPPSTSIVEIYERAGRDLLLLGAPGAGKTMLLLNLASELLTHAESDPAQPIPVILNLSSWASKKLPLATWLVDQLRLAYHISPSLGQMLLEQHRWLVLLDGLDEVAAPARSECIEAINRYHDEHIVLMVVCSRSHEYMTQQARLTLSSAVEIQPLPVQEVMEYLKHIGSPMAAVRAALLTDPGLVQLLSTPLWLSMVILVYRDTALKNLPRPGSVEELKRQIFTRYLDRRLEQQGIRSDFTPQQIRRWLVWLAQQMSQQGLTEFYLEQLQSTWLPTKQSRAMYRLFSRLLSLLTGPMGSKSKEEIRCVDKFVWQWTTFWRQVPGSLLFGLLVGWLVNVFSKPLSLVISFIVQGFSNLNFTTLPYEYVSKLPLKLMRLEQFLNGLLSNLPFLLIVGPLGVLAFSLLDLTSYGSKDAFLTATNERERLNPNQGVQNSGRNALRLGFLVGLLCGLTVGGLFFWLFDESGTEFFALFFGLYLGLSSGLVCGLMGGLDYGGQAYLQHYFLRFLLWRCGAMPWHYVRFLEEAHERSLLQRVGIGGGYRFIHPLFQEYLVSLGTGTSTDG